MGISGQIVSPHREENYLAKRLLSRRKFILGGIGIFAYYLYFEDTAIAVKRYTVPVINLPDEFNGFTILHLSDLHNNEHGSGQSRLLKLIQRENFDIVALTGDFLDKRNPKIEPVISLIQGIKDKPTFFVPGNHEWGLNFSIRDNLESLGVEVLVNKSYKYVLGKSHLWIVGVDDPYLGRDDLNKAMGEIKDDFPKILLAHAPNIFKKAVAFNIDLTLVGHTHGGQIRIPFLGAIYVPGQGLFPKYDYGLYQEDSKSMIISAGLGESIFPIRVFNRPEIVFVKLVQGF